MGEAIERTRKGLGVEVSVVQETTTGEWFIVAEAIEDNGIISIESAWHALRRPSDANPGRDFTLVWFEDSLEVHGFVSRENVMRWHPHFLARLRTVTS